jgi:hypothetical protein
MVRGSAASEKKEKAASIGENFRIWSENTDESARLIEGSHSKSGNPDANAVLFLLVQGASKFSLA